MMNLFTLAGNVIHLLCIVGLLLKIHISKSCAGISLKTQELYVIVSFTQYLNKFIKYSSINNNIMQLICIGSSIVIVWYMRHHKVVHQTYNKDQDTFMHYNLVVACFLSAILLPFKFITLNEVYWTFTSFLEAVAILPQFVLVQRSRDIDYLTGILIFLYGAYRALYVLDYLYYFMQIRIYIQITWFPGVVQVALYAYFLYYCKKSWKNNETLKLPDSNVAPDLTVQT